MDLQSKYLWMNGRLVAHRDASLHFLTPGLHYGIGVFEGIRCYATATGPAVFRLREHLERLETSAKVLGWRDLPYSVDELLEAVKQLVAANGYSDCYIRPLVYLAEGGWNLSIDSGKPHVGIALWKWDTYFGKEILERGIRANTSSFTRHHVNATMTKAKICGNYVNSVLAKSESARLGFDEAIMLDTQGYVAECTGENLFVVRGATLYTPPLAEVLEGITRDSVLALARDLGYQVAEQPISRDQLYIADEVFVCGTAAEVVGLREIDFRKIGSGAAGPVTLRLQKVYADAIRGRHPRSRQWLTHVAMDSATLPLMPNPGELAGNSATLDT
jgi:branched-chain amino acid aminotransferase